jgi:hypothetical protein
VAAAGERNDDRERATTRTTAASRPLWSPNRGDYASPAHYIGDGADPATPTRFVFVFVFVLDRVLDRVLDGGAARSGARGPRCPQFAGFRAPHPALTAFRLIVRKYR